MPPGDATGRAVTPAGIRLIHSRPANRTSVAMQTPMIDAYAVARSGVEALRRGDALKARELFERIFNTGQADASSCLGLAYACSRLNDKAATLVAVDRALAL